MSAIDRLAGKRILEEAVSDINGTVSVIREFLWGTYIMAGGLPQSGGLAERIWRKPLARVKRQDGKRVKEILILGFGGGGMVPIVKKHWPKAKITGVDVDPIMVEFGRKYLKWDKYEPDVVIADAEKYIAKCKKKFDLICVDMYVGQQVPGKFNTVSFINKIKKLLTKDGIAVFNRLYGGGNKEAALGFGYKLEQVFPKIITVRPEANMMFICHE